MAEPSICPPLSPRQTLFATLPPGVFGFFLGCKDGAPRCAIDQAEVAIQIKWTDVVAQGWIAPGGNRYWKTSIPAAPSDPRALAVFRLLASRSADAFRSMGRNGTAKMADVMAAGQWVSTYGAMTVPIQPHPQETVGAFVARGGYLLDLRPSFSPILGPPGGRINDASAGVRWQGQGASTYPWLADSNILVAELWGNYDPHEGKINCTLRLVYKGKWDRAVAAVTGAISAAAATFCGKLVEHAGTAMTVSTAFPAAKPYMGAYTAALTACGLTVNQVPPAPCIPREPRPEDLTVVAGPVNILLAHSTGRKGAFAQAPDTMTLGIKVAATTPLPPTPPSPSGYPPGTIAWRDPAAGYSVAVPAPTDDVTHRVVAMGQPAVPAGVHVVDRGEWERATLPWVRRRTSKIGLMAGGVVFAIVGTAAALRATT